MADPTYDVRGDFQGNGGWADDVVGVFDSWSDLVDAWTWLDLVGSQVPDTVVENIQINRILSDFRESLSTGTAQITLDNKDREYSPAETSANGNTNMKDDKRISIKAKSDVGSWQGLFSGTIKNVRLDANDASPKTRLTAEDDAAILRKEISLGLKADTKPNSLVQDILDDVDYPGPAFIETIDDNIPFSNVDDQSAGSAIQEIKQSGGHFAFIDRRGAFQFKKRGADAGASLADGFTEFLDYSLEIPSVEKVINKAIVRSRPRQATSDQKTLAWVNNAPPVNANSNIDFFLGYRDPETGQLRTPSNSVGNPVSSNDFQMNTSSDGTGTDLTAQTSLTVDKFAKTAKFTVRNTSGSDGFLIKCQIRGFPLQEQPVIRASSEISSSISKFGENTLEIDNDLIPEHSFASSYSTFIVEKLKDHYPILTLSPKKNRFPANIETDLLDEISITNSITNVDTNFIVNEITHNIEFADGLEHTVGYVLELTNKPTVF